MSDDTFTRYERFITTGIIFLVIFISSVFTIQWQSSSINEKHINDLMSYCEKITGQKQASFNNDGSFIGCETVLK